MDRYFTTRVLLHQATEDDYETLHEGMEAEGFSRTVKSDDGTEYHLPQAEYSKVGVFTGTGVRDAATRAANKTGKKNAVLVTVGVSRHWIGLEKVKK